MENYPARRPGVLDRYDLMFVVADILNYHIPPKQLTTKYVPRLIVNTILKTIVDAVRRGETVWIKGFGTFVARRRVYSNALQWINNGKPPKERLWYPLKVVRKRAYFFPTRTLRESVIHQC